MYEYPVMLTFYEGLFIRVIACPDIPELIGDEDEDDSITGETISETLEAAAQRLAQVLNDYVEQRHPIPLASVPAKNQYSLHLPIVMVARITLWNSLLELGLREIDWCRHLNINLSVVRRLLDFQHPCTIEQLEQVLCSMGKRLVVAVESIEIFSEWPDDE